MSHDGGMFDETFDAAEAFGKREEANVFEEVFGGVQAVVKVESDHGAESGHL